ncbi:MAG: hypothetical protein ABI277_15845 [Burkholderiaceae bacterium]
MAARRGGVGGTTPETRDAADATLAMSEIAQVRFRTRDRLLVHAYADDKSARAFIVIDALTNHTIAAGMIVRDEAGR